MGPSAPLSGHGHVQSVWRVLVPGSDPMGVFVERRVSFVVVFVSALAGASLSAAETETVPAHPDLAFINTAFENASPLWWEVEQSGAIQIHLLYDHQRSSPNRAAGHWFFELQGRPGADLTLSALIATKH